MPNPFSSYFLSNRYSKFWSGTLAQVWTKLTKPERFQFSRHKGCAFHRSSRPLLNKLAWLTPRSPLWKVRPMNTLVIGECGRCHLGIRIGRCSLHTPYDKCVQWQLMQAAKSLLYDMHTNASCPFRKCPKTWPRFTFQKAIDGVR